MNMMRKVTVILIAMIILVTVFTGCAKKSGDKDSSDITTIYSKNEESTVEKEATTDKEAAKQAETNGSASKIAKAKVGDIVVYGNYEQDNDTANGKEEIAWKVLAVENGKALLISEKILDTEPYNVEQETVTWETCSLRTWLNNDFLTSAFTSNEETSIVATTIINNDNTIYHTDGGNDTNDRIFLLSYEEAIKYFANDAARIAQGTDFAKSKGLSFSESGFYFGNSLWWLRSPGDVPDGAGYVGHDGRVYNVSVYITGSGARPALWINL